MSAKGQPKIEKFFETYAISAATRDSLNEALEMVTPASPNSTLTVGQKQQKESRSAEEASEERGRMQRPRLNLQRPGSRTGTHASTQNTTSGS